MRLQKELLAKAVKMEEWQFSSYDSVLRSLSTARLNLQEAYLTS